MSKPAKHRSSRWSFKKVGIYRSLGTPVVLNISIGGYGTFDFNLRTGYERSARLGLWFGHRLALLFIPQKCRDQWSVLIVVLCFKMGFKHDITDIYDSTGIQDDDNWQWHFWSRTITHITVSQKSYFWSKNWILTKSCKSCDLNFCAKIQ